MIPIMVSMMANAYREDDADDPISLITMGEMERDGNIWKIQYKEQLDEQTAIQDVCFTCEGSTIRMERKGTYRLSMMYEKGKRFEGIYETPFGEMAMAIFCTYAHYELTEKGGVIFVKYQLDMNGQFISMHELHLQITVKDA